MVRVRGAYLIDVVWADVEFRIPPSNVLFAYYCMGARCRRV